MPETLAGILKAYVEAQKILPDQRLFPSQRSLVKKARGQNEGENTAPRSETPFSNLREPERSSPRSHL
jgi:hypothetical protein